MAMGQGIKLALIGTVVLVAAVGVRFWMIKRDENAPAAYIKKTVPSYTITDDDNVFLKQLHANAYADLHDLVGKPLWGSAGGQMDYFPYTAGHVDYAHKAGILLGAQQIMVASTTKAVAPKTAGFRVPAGDKQYLLVFTFPAATAPGASANAGLPADQTKPGKQFAVPVGNIDKGNESFFVDTIFFYEDPHELYKHWGAANWKAIDEHRAIVGMSEKEAQTALGQVFSSGSNDYGNRTVNFNNVDHPITITFEKNKATRVQ